MENLHICADEDEEDWQGVWDDASYYKPVQPSSVSIAGAQSVADGESDRKGESSSRTATKDSELMSRMQLNDHKAGMQGLDRQKINSIILEASKGSRYFENEQKKEKQVKQRIDVQTARLQKLTAEEIQQGILHAEHELATLEHQRDLSHTIVHVDMDAFYAAVEERRDPSLRGRPMGVGGMSMLATSNYIARRFGVRAAMPGFIAKKLCPDLVIVPTHSDLYREVSKQVREVLAVYDPNFSPVSLDEAYLDLTEHMARRPQMSIKDRTFERTVVADNESCHCEKRKESPENEPQKQNICESCGKPLFFKQLPENETFGVTVAEAVKEMRFRIHQKTKLTASAGIAPNTMLAKVCSDKNKPNGQYEIPPTLSAITDFVRELPIRKISGIGKVSEQMLKALGIQTCPDLYVQRGILYHLYSQTSFTCFMRISLGIGSTQVERDSERKSVSVERTFGEISTPIDLYKKCYELSQSLAKDLEEEDVLGKTVTLKLKTVQFEVKTKAHSLAHCTRDADLIYNTARELLRAEIQGVSPLPLRLRLMGVRMSNFGVPGRLDNKQETIVNIFKKIESKSSPVENSVVISEKDLFASERLEPNSSKKFTTSELYNKNVANTMLNRNTENKHESEKPGDHVMAHQWSECTSSTEGKKQNMQLHIPFGAIFKKKGDFEEILNSDRSLKSTDTENHSKMELNSNSCEIKMEKSGENTKNTSPAKLPVEYLSGVDTLLTLKPPIQVQIDAQNNIVTRFEHPANSEVGTHDEFPTFDEAHTKSEGQTKSEACTYSKVNTNSEVWNKSEVHLQKECDTQTELNTSERHSPCEHHTLNEGNSSAVSSMDSKTVETCILKGSPIKIGHSISVQSTDSEVDNYANMEDVICPICGKTLSNSSIDKTNRHINQCLDSQNYTCTRSTSSSELNELTPKRIKSIKVKTPAHGKKLPKKNTKVVTSNSTSSCTGNMQSIKSTCLVSSAETEIFQTDPCVDNKTVSSSDGMTSLQNSQTVGKAHLLAGNCGVDGGEGSSEEQAIDYICPVCHAPLWKQDLASFNRHVDACLSREAIRDVIKQTQPTNKRHADTIASPSGSSGKRRRTAENQPSYTLHSFFSKK